MKILYITTISNTMEFFPEHIKMLQSQGHTVELACNMQKPFSNRISVLRCKVHEIPFSRNPLSTNNVKAYMKLEKLIKDEKYDLIHTHTPNASVCARLAARKLRKKGLTVIYTAHGFHFYKGAPLKNWLLYYPIEKLCSHWTDVLITINKEDYALAKRKMKAKQVEFISGVGVDTEKFAVCDVDRETMRQELGVKQDEIMIFSVGELSDRKNHEIVIRAIVKLKDRKIKYYIAGTGELKKHLENLAAEFGISRQFHILGYRKDIPELLRAADIFCFPSKQEGLPVALMEAMASGLPVVCSKIRGNVDLIDEGKGCYLLNPLDVDGFAEKINELACIEELRKEKGSYNLEKIKNFDVENVKEEMIEIYREIIKL